MVKNTKKYNYLIDELIILPWKTLNTKRTLPLSMVSTKQKRTLPLSMVSTKHLAFTPFKHGEH